MAPYVMIIIIKIIIMITITLLTRSYKVLHINVHESNPSVLSIHTFIPTYIYIIKHNASSCMIQTQN